MGRLTELQVNDGCGLICRQSPELQFLHLLHVLQFQQIGSDARHVHVTRHACTRIDMHQNFITRDVFFTDRESARERDVSPSSRMMPVSRMIWKVLNSTSMENSDENADALHQVTQSVNESSSNRQAPVTPSLILTPPRRALSHASAAAPGLPRLEDESSRESSSSASSVLTAAPLRAPVGSSSVSPDTTTFSWLNLGVSSSSRSSEKSNVSLRGNLSVCRRNNDRTRPIRRLLMLMMNRDEEEQEEVSSHRACDVIGETAALQDIMCVDDQTVQRLTDGFLHHYLPELQTSKQTLQELTQNQVILLDTLEQEVTKFRECNTMVDLNALFIEAKLYHNKLVNIRKEMMVLHDKTTKLKKRALKVQQHKQKNELEREQQRERDLERERRLIAKPAKRVDT
ncbi:biogenesis of lysosome-related organelles complex 1 subunit 6 [Triplophysa rosa]|nr:biogenesis of lysosome-related organelles complex 1 subunit 6 [Triplophysa rosa]